MIEVLDNKEKNRYEYHIGDDVAFVNYSHVMGKLALEHTEVPATMQGKGIGSQLIKYVLNDAKQNNQKIFPICPFISSYIKKHPEWLEIVDKGYKWK